MHHQGEIHGHRVIALVNHRFGKIQRIEAGIFQETIVEQSLMHTWRCRAIIKRRGHHIAQAGQNIIGVQHRIFRHLAQTIGAMAHHVRQRAHIHAHLPMEGDHAAKWIFIRPQSRIVHRLNQRKTSLARHHEWQRRERREAVG